MEKRNSCDYPKKYKFWLARNCWVIPKKLWSRNKSAWFHNNHELYAGWILHGLLDATSSILIANSALDPRSLMTLFATLIISRFLLNYFFHFAIIFHHLLILNFCSYASSEKERMRLFYFVQFPFYSWIECFFLFSLYPFKKSCKENEKYLHIWVLL